ncbi:HNH endonuclease signature motif containing protein [Microbacterium sp. 18062]|uniref:HNH endonuclease signature motif containing protein n=1 Tax=Microbacterium sp. 18062 TaxID=2681410 RepID=UPI00135CE1F9|nr:HNH endonuclease signature motif containing protein [Microbacterium sp. 18062]
MHDKTFQGLSDADAAALSEIVHEVASLNRQAAAVDAQRWRTLTRAFDLAQKQASSSKGRDMALRGLAAEIAAATKASDRSLQRQIGDAATRVRDYPATLAAYESGDITKAHVHLITELGTPLPPDKSAGRLRDELAILAESVHPRTLTERHQEAREQRGVRTFAVGDGMSGLILTGPTLLIEGIHDRVTQQGRTIIDARTQAKERLRARAAADAATAGHATGAGAAGTAFRRAEDHDQDALVASDDRTIDQVRADIITDMLLTAQPGADPTRSDDGPGTLGAIRATVQVVVPALTLLGADERPADLVGRSPIDADTTRKLADATGAAGRHWVRVVTAPIAGTVLHADTRLATPAQRLFLRARDRHCRWPGCRVPAIRCEADHTIDHCEGGPTCIHNLECLCQRHHSMKQFTPWAVRQRGGGVLEWTSPLGHVYIDEPPVPTVHFVPHDGPDPGDPPPDPSADPGGDPPPF